jgi:hypothetical protein
MRIRLHSDERGRPIPETDQQREWLQATAETHAVPAADRLAVRS